VSKFAREKSKIDNMALVKKLCSQMGRIEEQAAGIPHRL
jgi:hypothetical protein